MPFVGTPYPGQFYIQNDNQDFWMYELNGGVYRWVRKGNIRDEGSTGIVSVQPNLGHGFNMAVTALDRIMYLGTIAQDVGYSLDVAELLRIRLITTAMSLGYSEAAAITLTKQIIMTASDLGISMQALVHTDASGLVELGTVAVGLGFDQATMVDRLVSLAAAMNVGYSQSNALTILHYLGNVDIAIGAAQAASLSLTVPIVASMALGFANSTTLSRVIAIPGSSHSLGYDQAQTISHSTAVTEDGGANATKNGYTAAAVSALNITGYQASAGNSAMLISVAHFAPSGNTRTISSISGYGATYTKMQSQNFAFTLAGTNYTFVVETWVGVFATAAAANTITISLIGAMAPNSGLGAIIKTFNNINQTTPKDPNANAFKTSQNATTSTSDTTLALTSTATGGVKFGAIITPGEFAPVTSTPGMSSTRMTVAGVIGLDLGVAWQVFNGGAITSSNVSFGTARDLWAHNAGVLQK